MREPAPAGLSGAEAAARLRAEGPNELPEARRASLALRALKQVKSPLIYILLFALVLELALWARGEAGAAPIEALTIAVLLVLNAALGVAQDYRSDAAMGRLRALAAPHAWAIRDGVAVQLPARQIVPGDVVRLDAGDRVPADARLHGDLLLDESVLTGESLPVERGEGDEVSGGTLVVRGRAHATVTRTGRASAIGRFAGMLGSVEQAKTPLERRLETLARQTARVVLVLAGALILGGLYVEGTARFADVFLFAVALAVAIVPEELPAVLTLTLSLAVERMAKRKALVRRLASVETLGSVTVIATDKTGTLTENRLRVAQVEALDEARALRAMAWANDAEPSTGHGDPLELALLAHVAARVPPARRLSERPFDSAWKCMRATVASVDGPESYVKGAPEAVLARCALPDAERDAHLLRAEEWARDGRRVLALAWAPGETEEGLAFVGLVGLRDPPRAEVAGSIALAQQAGVRVVMVTGDHPGTALAVAREVGIRASRAITGDELDRMTPAQAAEAARGCDVFARVTPERKLRIVEALQADGEVVAMTGDGVNDAPALKKADIGVAMGMRGSDVAREAASLVLLDDDFRTIVAAIEEGRSLTENIQKFLRFMFSIHVAFFTLLVAGAVGAYALGMRDEAGDLILPLTALQILWLNFLADGPPSFALGLDRNRDIMRTRPAPTSGPLLDRGSVAFIGIGAALKAGFALAMLVALPGLGFSILQTQAAVFAYEFLGQVVYAYPARRLRVDPEPNLWLHASALVGVGLLLLSFAPPVRALLELAPLPAQLVAVVAGASAVTWACSAFAARALRLKLPAVPSGRGLHLSKPA